MLAEVYHSGERKNEGKDETLTALENREIFGIRGVLVSETYTHVFIYTTLIGLSGGELNALVQAVPDAELAILRYNGGPS